MGVSDIWHIGRPQPALLTEVMPENVPGLLHQYRSYLKES